jgi:hypothetical protein
MMKILFTKKKNAEGSFSGISSDGDSVILHIGYYAGRTNWKTGNCSG